MTTTLMPWQSSCFEYALFGQGPQVVVCLHGYGEEAGSFAFLEKHLGREYTFIALNLPYHGATQWKEQTPFTVHHLQLVLAGIFTRAGITASRFTLLGYSMGGRIAMALTAAFPEKINRLCLVAPDGMTLNFWYWLATQTTAGNALFRFTMKHPGWLMGFVKIAYRLGMLNSSIGKFLDYYIGDPLVRQQLYERWTCMRLFTPHLSTLQQHINTHQLPVRLLYGKYDRIILPVRGQRFTGPIGRHGSMVVLEAGHQLLREKYVAALADLLRS